MKLKTPKQMSNYTAKLRASIIAAYGGAKIEVSPEEVTGIMREVVGAVVARYGPTALANYVGLDSTGDPLSTYPPDEDAEDE